MVSIDKVSKVRRVFELLRRAYGPKYREPEDPLDVLVITILSQNTSDANSSRAYERLRSRFCIWEDVLNADFEEVVDAIRVGGLAREKASYIRRILEEIKASHGECNLDFLCELGPGEALRYLKSFRGVGPKTAACVLLFGCGFPVFPVDTHILRITRRLGLVPEDADLSSAHELMAGLVPEELTYELHVNLIAHGRRVCRPHKPLCEECVLQDECLHYSGIPRVEEGR